jgi:Ca2+/Na+ antiporter
MALIISGIVCTIIGIAAKWKTEGFSKPKKRFTILMIIGLLIALITLYSIHIDIILLQIAGFILLILMMPFSFYYLSEKRG